MVESNLRSVVKGISWRIVGTIDTFLVAYLILIFTGESEEAATGAFAAAGTIASFEVVTKFILYFLHERVWTKVKWGHLDKKIFMTVDLTTVVEIAEQAGEKIMEIYNQPETIEVLTKDDKSPLTAADQAANAHIVSELQKLYPDIPVISEEEKQMDFATRKHWTHCWLIDPLDGTKEFIKRNGDFTVNIALLEKGKSILGVVHAPDKNITAWAEKGKGAFLKDAVGVKRLTGDAPADNTKMRIVCSRSHNSPEVEAYLKKFEDPEIASRGSSFKFLLLATGEADIYPRLAPTMEWDTGAAQIIVEESGGKVISQKNGLPMEYNKENLLNPFFIAYRKGASE